MVGSLFAQDIDASRMSETEKMILYKQNDKSPLLARLCALIPTMGHMYVEQWNKRLIPNKYLLIAAASAVYAEHWRWNNRSWSYDWSKTDIENHNIYTAWDEKHDTMSLIQNIGAISILGWYYLQLQDAVYLAKQHNAVLYKQIYGREYIRTPKKSIVQKLIDKKKSKKP